MSQPVETHLHQHVLHIKLNRPTKMNAFSVAMLQGLAAAYTALEDTSEARCGLLYAAGDHFTAGLDLAEVAKQLQKSGNTLFEPTQVDPLQLHGRSRTKPVVMAVQGYCLTIGIELILAAEITVAHPETQFGQIEVQRGIFPFGGATIRFPQRCGWGNAMRYLMTGDKFDATEAHRIGLVQALASDPLAEATQLAERIAQQAPLAVQASLLSSRQALEGSVDKAIEELYPTLSKLMASQDAAEGVQSFIERRQAKFTGN